MLIIRLVTVYLLAYLLVQAPSHAAVLVKDKMWPKGSTLAVVFLDGKFSQKASVKQYAPLWLEGTSLSFKFYDSLEKAPKQTHIRVSFTSYDGAKLGNHGDYLSKHATLLLNSLNDPDLPEEDKKRLILHEFGHALGFEHEYRNPNWPFGNAPIEQQIKDCIPRMEKIGHSPEKAHKKCHEINSLLEKSLVHTTIYDEFSIMNYPQLIKLGADSFKRIEARSELSLLDQLAIQQWYD
jgi:hypothetical protein